MFKQFTRRPDQPEASVVPLHAGARAPSSAERGPADPLQPTPEERDLIAFLELKGRLHDALLDRLNFAVIDKIMPDELRREVASLAEEVLAAENRPMRGPEFQRLVDELMHEVLGLGPLEPLLADPTVNDILVTAIPASSSSVRASSSKRPCGSATRSTSCGSSTRSSRVSGAGWTSRCRGSMPASRTAAA
jgi:hypothetical protein